MGFTLVTSIPEICNIKCLCFKCGLKNFPDLLHDWWCEGVYCCNFNNFGLKELLMFQYFLFGPCSLIAPACNLTFAVPVLIYPPIYTVYSNFYWYIYIGGLDGEHLLPEVWYSRFPGLSCGRFYPTDNLLHPLRVRIQRHTESTSIILFEVWNGRQNWHLILIIYWSDV